MHLNCFTFILTYKYYKIRFFCCNVVNEFVFYQGTYCIVYCLCVICIKSNTGILPNGQLIWFSFPLQFTVSRINSDSIFTDQMFTSINKLLLCLLFLVLIMSKSEVIKNLGCKSMEWFYSTLCISIWNSMQPVNDYDGRKRFLLLSNGAM